MKSFTIAATLLSLLPFISAAPTATSSSSSVEARSGSYPIIFYGAGGAEYSISFPTDDQVHAVDNPLSVSHIVSISAASCTFFGVDGSSTFVAGGSTGSDVGPPQAITSGVCDI